MYSQTLICHKWCTVSLYIQSNGKISFCKLFWDWIQIWEFEFVSELIFCNAWSQYGHLVPWTISYYLFFSPFDCKSPDHQITYTVVSQPGDCRWPLSSSSAVCVCIVYTLVNIPYFVPPGTTPVCCKFHRRLIWQVFIFLTDRKVQNLLGHTCLLYTKRCWRHKACKYYISLIWLLNTLNWITKSFQCLGSQSVVWKEKLLSIPTMLMTGSIVNALKHEISFRYNYGLDKETNYWYVIL